MTEQANSFLAAIVLFVIAGWLGRWHRYSFRYGLIVLIGCAVLAQFVDVRIAVAGGCALFLLRFAHLRAKAAFYRQALKVTDAQAWELANGERMGGNPFRRGSSTASPPGRSKTSGPDEV